jgi:hypothetical protein
MSYPADRSLGDQPPKTGGLKPAKSGGQLALSNALANPQYQMKGDGQQFEIIEFIIINEIVLIPLQTMLASSSGWWQ